MHPCHRLKNLKTFISAIAFLSLVSCDSRYTPRTVPDTVPPKIFVRITGNGISEQHTIFGMTINPEPPAITPNLNPGKVYHVSAIATDTIGLFNLRVGLNTDFFEITDISATPGTVSTSVMGQYTVIDVDLPISPAKTGTALSFNVRPKPMPQGTLAPFLGLNVIATDFGEAGRSSNISGYTIPIGYFAE